MILIIRSTTLSMLLFYAVCASAQKREFGKFNIFDNDYTVFSKDTTASAVYLYEYGDNYFEVRDDYVWLITRYHARIKILKKEGFEHANIEIPYYHNENSKEKVQKIRAITHNGKIKTSLLKDAIFDTDENERWSAKKFTFPNVSVGSILEYTYEVQSPFFFNLNGWNFQSDIPKVYTEYNAKIPGNWVYNRSLIGELELDVNEATLKKDCFTIPRASEPASCENLVYVMKEVPAFRENESYMLAGSNYRSKLKFELAEYEGFTGIKKRYTKSWKDVDREFKQDKDLGRQLNKKNFFEKKVPDSILTEGKLLERAKKIYAYVQNHFNWNEKNGVWKDNRVKIAFDNRKGNTAEINITLINLLNAAGIKSNMMLSATRNRGLPKKNEPVMSDFNYVIAKTNIDGVNYLLDATDKKIPFGMLPFRCLNYYGRVMDFDDKSYWHPIEAEKNNKKIVRVSAVLDSEKNTFKGVFNTINTGYYSVNKRNMLEGISNQKYLSTLEESSEKDFVITEYELKKEFSNDKKLVEQFGFEIENVDHQGKIFLNPFLIQFNTSNPFKSKNRYYPIDFGYTRSNTYTLSLAIPEGYKVKSLPDSKSMALQDKSCILRFECKEQKTGNINVFYEFKLNGTQYHSDAYDLIKLMFEEAVLAQTKSYIVLEKV